MKDRVEQAYREHWGRLLALLVRDLRAFDLAEDSLQDAFAAAVRQWPQDGPPDNPAAWLLTAARRRALDRLRREATLERKLPLLIVDSGPEEPAPDIPDERLRLIFTCCHPALRVEARVALTLRCVAGLTTPQIARMFLVQESTMAARITRAKKKIATSGVPYRVPSAEQLPERLGGVLAVIYLVFTEGYAATDGDRLVQDDLAEEAIRLGRLLVSLLPEQTEATALLALMIFQHARRDARVDSEGGLVRLGDQDRTLWRWDEIAEARTLMDRSGGTGRYWLQAAVASEHVRSDGPDWCRIARLYEGLESINRSPIVRLNRAVAVAEAVGPEAGLALLDGLDVPERHLLPATRAEFLVRLGRQEEAIEHFRTALSLAKTGAERRLLNRRLEDASADESNVDFY